MIKRRFTLFKSTAFAYFIAFFVILGCWQLLTFIAGDRIVPPPFAVIARTFALLRQDLWKHLFASFGRVISAVALACVTAVPIAVIIGRNQTIRRIVSPAAYLLHPIPKIALLPVFMLLFGMGNMSKIFVVYLVVFFQMLITIRDAAAKVRPESIVSIMSLGAGRAQVFRYVIFPSLLPDFFTALRLAAATSLAVLFFAETFFVRFGLGFFILESWMRINYTDMLVGILVLSLLGLGLVSLFDLLERLFCPWLRTVVIPEEGQR